MLKKTNYLIKDLIQSDFFILNYSFYKLKKISNDYFEKNVNLYSLLSLNKEVKQFINLLFFLKNKKSHVYIVTEKKEIILLIKKFLLVKSKNVKIFLGNTTPLFKRFPVITFIILWGDSDYVYNLKKKLQSLIFRNFFFFLNINSSKTNYFDFYKVHSEVENLKNSVFLILLIRKILNNNNY